MILGATAMDNYDYEHFFVLDGNFKLYAYKQLGIPAPVIILRLLEEDETSLIDCVPSQNYPCAKLRLDNVFKGNFRLSQAEWKIIPHTEKEEVNENFCRFVSEIDVTSRFDQ